MRLDPDELARVFLTHLEREEHALQASLDVLREAREALLRCDAAGLTALSEPQERAADENLRMRTARERLRASLAGPLGLPAQRVSLSTLAAHLPSDTREPLRRAGERVRRLAVEADELVRSNAALLTHLLRFTRGFLFDLTGGEEAAGGYGPKGTHLEASFGSLLSTRG